MQYALVDKNDHIKWYRDFAEPPTDPVGGKGATGPWRWLLVVVTVNPPYDRATQIRDPYVDTVQTVQVSRVFTVRDKTEQERDEEVEQAYETDQQVKALAMAIVSLTTISGAQMKTAFKAALRQLKGT